jgi:hypothetical protein
MDSQELYFHVLGCHFASCEIKGNCQVSSPCGINNNERLVGAASERLAYLILQQSLVLKTH